jgi:hypothetical protein
MNKIADLAAHLLDTHAAVRRLEGDIVAHPDADGLQVNMAALLKRQDSLARRFKIAADEAGIDVFDYSFVPARQGSYPLAAVAGALLNFQAMVTTIFDAVRNGPKKRAHISQEIAQLSTLEFGYSFSGSIGFALQVPNDRLLLVESDMDMAISLGMAASKASSIDEIAALAQKIGAAGMRRVYQLAETHAKYGISAKLLWTRGQQKKREAIVEAEEWKRLRDLLEQSGDVDEAEFPAFGTVVDLNFKVGTFHMSFAEGEDIRGRLDEAFDRTATRELPALYTARIRRVTKVSYATEEEQTSYALLSLASASQSE